jgi:hypothetical protein
MGRRWGRAEVYTTFWWEDLRERDHLKDLDVDCTIILKYLHKVGRGGMDWIDLGQDKAGVGRL